MTNLPWTRKRVFGLCCAPDENAFQKCVSHGVSVPIAIYDKHEYQLEKGHKRSKYMPKKEDNEADSTMVGKFDPKFVQWENTYSLSEF